MVQLFLKPENLNMESLEEQIQILKNKNSDIEVELQQLEQENLTLKVDLASFLNSNLEDKVFSEQQLRQLFPGPIVEQIISQSQYKEEIEVDLSDFSDLYF